MPAKYAFEETTTGRKSDLDCGSNAARYMCNAGLVDVLFLLLNA